MRAGHVRQWDISYELKSLCGQGLNTPQMNRNTITE